MYDLKCKREGCEFNKNCRCSARRITISSSAECTSYSPSENYNKQEKSKIPQKAVRVNTIADCQTTGCIFNHGGICVANGISVATINSQPECLTIKPK